MKRRETGGGEREERRSRGRNSVTRFRTEGRHGRVCFLSFFFFSSFSFSPLLFLAFLSFFRDTHTHTHTRRLKHEFRSFGGRVSSRCRRKRRMFRVFFARRLHPFYPVRGRKGGEIDGGSDESVGSGTKRGCTRCWF